MGSSKTAGPKYATLDELLAPAADTESGMPERDETLVINGKPRTVRVRALSRREALALRDVQGGAGAYERVILARAMVRPKMTEAEAERLQGVVLAGDLEALIGIVTDMSGLGEKKAMKEAVREFEADSDAEFPALPRAEAGNDGAAVDGRDA